MVKLVLHVGMSKSGSTAIQHGLVALRERLLEQGYLYPTGMLTQHNQSSLIAAVDPPDKLPRYFRPRYGNKPRKVARDFDAWIADIRTQIDRHRPKTVLMSGQTLFKLARPDQFEKLAAVLRPLCDEIDVVAYLRRPSDFYLSSAQQILKADHRIKPIAPPDYRAPLEGFRSIADRLHVFPYDRAQFPGGDVLRHFMDTFCPDAVPEEGLPKIAANVSLSAESLAILAAYRRKHHADKAGRFTKDSNRLLAALNAADAELSGNTRLKLKPELARIIDQGSPDLLWLRETHGVVFDGIDYDRIAPIETLPRPSRVAEICNFNRKRKAATALHAMRHLAEQA